MVFLYPVLPGCLSLSTKPPRTLPWLADHTFEPRLYSAEVTFILGPPSWTLMTKPHITSSFTNMDSHNSILPILRLLSVLGLDPWPNIYINTYYCAYYPYR